MINLSNLKVSASSITDDYGRVYIGEEKVYRVVFKEKVAIVVEMFSCGMMNELMSLNFIPQTRMLEFVNDQYGLLLEHEKIDVISYPYEWSFEMFKSVADKVLELNIVIAKYGYQTKDCHSFNLLFKNNEPIFIDIGSFIKERSDNWLAYNEFVRHYIIPLKLWSKGESHLVGCLLKNSFRDIPVESYIYINFPFLRMLSKKLVKKIIELYFSYKRLSEERIKIIFHNYYIKTILVFLLKNKLLPFKDVNLFKLKKKINNIKMVKSNSEWSNYHNEFIDSDGEIISSLRFNRVIEIIKELKPESILEIGGNSGILSMLIYKQKICNRIICSDYDELAVDHMYQICKKYKYNINPVLMDCLSPVFNLNTESPFYRYRSESVLALALSHHIILRNKIDVDYFLNILKKFSTKYVLVEFMPLGLYNGVNAPNLPNWYSIEWFRMKFSNHYETILEEQLEQNRILFIGKINKKIEVENV